ncbi:IQ motif and SEC7 domain-containing protein 3-like [Sinocyclocheilus rhinocerous]|uniref:IQ motif and SEC7 domain-containing protein 3-like n=1 Tax=Sinocyclocheilus rhinocerous TaxID=307959 RepID=UPI0007BA8B7F|nr:PREDICTED: IQ motif and SEC7 domain-containing protein 3-like [Sinocyclocheilus rhinocerous]
MDDSRFRGCEHAAKTHSIKNNGTQLELRGRQGSRSEKQEMNASQSGHNAVEVSIHNRLQTYQLNAAPQSPESTALLNHQRELFQQPPLQCASHTPLHSYQPVTLAEIRPDTLIQCQQIVKVIVLDKGGHGRMEAYLSQSPTHHQLIQSVVSTPVRSPDGGGNQGGNNDGSQPPLPPPPPPYNHPHQYIPPDPRLALQRTPSGSRSLM